MWLRFVQLSRLRRVVTILTGIGCALFAIHTMVILPTQQVRKTGHDALLTAQQRPINHLPNLSTRTPLPLPSGSVEVVGWKGNPSAMSVTLKGSAAALLDWLYDLQNRAWSATKVSLTHVSQGLMLEGEFYQHAQQVSSIARPTIVHFVQQPPQIEVTLPATPPEPPALQSCADIQSMTEQVRAVVHSGHHAHTEQSFFVLTSSPQRISIQDFLNQIPRSSPSFQLGYVLKKPTKLRIFEHDRRCLAVEFEVLKIPSNPVNWLP